MGIEIHVKTLTEIHESYVMLRVIRERVSELYEGFDETKDTENRAKWIACEKLFSFSFHI
jgi:hypothetical protein